MKRITTKSFLAVLMLMAFLFTGCAPDLKGMYMLGDATEETAVEKDWDFNPGEDFYGYVNAKYLSTLEFDSDYGGAGSVIEAAKLVDEQCEELIREIANGNLADYEKGSNEELIYKFYWQILEASSSGEGLMTTEEFEWVKSQIDVIQSASSIDEFLENVSAIENEFGIRFWGDMYVMPGLEDSSKEALYLRQFSLLNADLESVAKGHGSANILCGYINDSLSKYGVDKDIAEKRAREASYLAIDIAKNSMMDVGEDWDEDVKSAVRFTKDEFDGLMPNVGYDGFIKSVTGATDVTTDIYVIDVNQLAFIDSVMTDENLQKWKDFYSTLVMVSVSDLLPTEIIGVGAVWDTDKIAVSMVNSMLSSQVGEEYVKRYYDQDIVDDVYDMVIELIDQYKVLINESEYSEEAKKFMIAKLENISINIGAGDSHEINPEDSGLIGDSVFESFINLNRRNAEENVIKIGKISERLPFESMPPQTVNAYYQAYNNSINIPLAIINEPFYSPDKTYAQNLGGLGIVIGHEISHGFDDSGIKYDEFGNYAPERMPAGDVSVFEQVQKKTIEYYSSYRVLNYYNVDGEQTLGENLADISGLQCVLRLVKSEQEKKEVFESFAHAFASLELNTMVLSQVFDDVHSPDKVRINACVALMDEFYEVYDISESDDMFVSPENRFMRW